MLMISTFPGPGAFSYTPTFAHLIPPNQRSKKTILSTTLTHPRSSVAAMHLHLPVSLSAEAKCALGLFHRPPNRCQSLGGPFLRRHGCMTYSSRCMVESESRWSWMMDVCKPSSSNSTSTVGYCGRRSDESSMRVGVRLNASVTLLAFLGFPFVNSHQL